MRSTVDNNNHTAAVALDRQHIWHHLLPHQSFKKNNLIIIVKEISVWDAEGNIYLQEVPRSVGPSTYVFSAIHPVRHSLVLSGLI